MSESTKTLLIIGGIGVLVFLIHTLSPILMGPPHRLCFDPGDIAVIEIGPVLEEFGGDPNVVHLDLHRAKSNHDRWVE